MGYNKILKINNKTPKNKTEKKKIKIYYNPYNIYYYYYLIFILIFIIYYIIY